MRIYLLLLIGICVVSCKSVVETNFRDDFKGMEANEVAVFLKKNKASSKERSVLFLTQGFKGEKIVITQGIKTVYSSYPISNLNTRIADFFSVDNQNNLVIQDVFSKKEIIINSKNAKKHKFIYVMKIYEAKAVKYKITYSNTLRILK